MKKIPVILFVLLTCLVSAVLSGRQEQANPRVLIKTCAGDIVVELFERQAPITVANFLAYVDKGLYQGACFYRVVRPDNQPQSPVKIEVIQGGLGAAEETRALPPILHETTEKTGVRHRDGTISMARDKPGTASSEFFICINDQPELDFGGRRNPDGQGFAAFGRVIRGKDVVRSIQRLDNKAQMLERPAPILSVSRIN
jgi:peptidyl-prolyl cis-trans isomerase A (cyclophilin A)